MAGALTSRFRVQSVVTDLFHTLVDPDVYRPEGFTRADRIAEVLGLTDRKAFVQWWREMEVQRHVNGSKKVVQYADEYVSDHSGRHCTREELAQIDHIWGHMHDQALLKPEPEVLSTLGALRAGGVKLGLLSNIDEREALNWERSPLAPLFDVVCLSYRTGYSKPSREAFALALSELGAEAALSIYVGDGNHDELIGARGAGFGLVVFMKGFVARGGQRSAEFLRRREAQADVTITNLDELRALAENFAARRNAKQDLEPESSA